MELVLRDILKAPGDYDAQTAFGATVRTLEEHYFVQHLSYFVQYSEDDGTRPVILHNFPDNWVQHYIEKNYFKIDPILQRARSKAEPFLWNELDWKSKGAAAFFRDAEEFGLGMSGISIPIRASAGGSIVISMTSDMHPFDWRGFLSTRRAEFELIAFQLHQAIMIAAGPSLSAHLSGLSEREVEVLQSMVSGRTNDQVAADLKITERTVRAHLNSARDKLKATNKTHAIAKAICFGLIDLAR